MARQLGGGFDQFIGWRLSYALSCRGEAGAYPARIVVIEGGDEVAWYSRDSITRNFHRILHAILPGRSTPSGGPVMSMLQYVYILKRHLQEVGMTKSRRLQVLVEDEQWERLETEAEERGVSVASLVRDAIDALLPGGRDDRRRAARRILGAPPMDVPDPDQLQDELDTLRGRRA